MTKRQVQALKFIEKFIQEHGYSPSYREISEGIPLSSVSNAHNLVRALVDQGKIKKLDGRSRTIEVVN